MVFTPSPHLPPPPPVPPSVAMARMAQSVPDKVDRPGRVMTRDYDNRSRIPSSARCIVPSPSPGTPVRPRALFPTPVSILPSVSFFPSLHLASLSSAVHPLPSPSVARFGSRHPSSPMRASLGYCPSTRSLYSTLFIYRALSGYIFLSRVGCEYGALASPCDPLRVCVLDVDKIPFSVITYDFLLFNIQKDRPICTLKTIF